MKYGLVLKQSLLSVSLAIAAVASLQPATRAESVDSMSGNTGNVMAPVKTQSQSTLESSAPLSAIAQTADAAKPQLSEITDAPMELASPTPVTTDVPAQTPGTTATDVVPTTTQPHLLPPAPVPGTAGTSARELKAQTPTEVPPAPPADAPTAAPAETSTAVETRYRFSYVGFGANLGAGSGDTALGEVSFAAFSKFAFSPYFSFRPSVLVSNDVSFLLPFTYDFPNRGPGNISPYVGVGPVFSTGRSDNVDLLLTGGLDYPLNPQLALTASVNVAPLNKFDIGFILGIAYTFATETITTPVVSLQDVVPARPPRANPSYLGGGVNFGAGGDSGLGNISGAIYSKIAIASYISFRPAILISSNVSFLLPVTYDFDVITLSDYIRLAPYAGVGVMFSTGDDSNADLLFSGGVDIPLSDQFAATVGVNIAPLDKFDIGFLVGVAYTFGPFAR